MNIPEFISLKNYTSLSEFHHNGGELKEDMELFFEANYRTELKVVILKTWFIGSVKLDITGYGKYSESSTMCLKDEKLTSIPFTMLYIKNENSN